MRHVKTKLLTPKEVAKLLKVTDRTVTRWCRQGRLQHQGTQNAAFKLGRVWRIHSDFYVDMI